MGRVCALQIVTGNVGRLITSRGTVQHGCAIGALFVATERQSVCVDEEQQDTEESVTLSQLEESIYRDDSRATVYVL